MPRTVPEMAEQSWLIPCMRLESSPALNCLKKGAGKGKDACHDRRLHGNGKLRLDPGKGELTDDPHKSRGNRRSCQHDAKRHEKPRFPRRHDAAVKKPRERGGDQPRRVPASVTQSRKATSKAEKIPQI